MRGGRSAAAPAKGGWSPRSGAALRLLVPLAAILQACAGTPSSRALAAPSAPSARAAPPGRLVVVPDRGALEIALPADWALARVDRRPGEEGPAVTFVLTPTDGRFRISLSPLNLPPGERPRLEEARRCAEAARAAVAPRAAEPELSLRALKGGGVGYWFAATDRELLARAPSPEEWRGVVEGCAVVGDLLMGFQVLDDLPGHHRGELLEALAGARHLPPEREEDPLEPGGTVEAGSELRASFPGRSWSVAVSAPGFTVVPARLDADGERVRAALFDRPDGVRVRVELWEAPGASSAVACREPEWARLQGSPGGLPDGRTWEEGEWAHASFVRAGRAVTRAWTLREGTCVRAELSAPRAVGTGGYQMILRSLRFLDGATELEGLR